MDPQSGEILWTSAGRQADSASLVSAGKHLFLLTDDARLTVATANRNAYEPVAAYEVAGSATWSQPVIIGKRILIKDRQWLTLWTL